MSAPAYHNYVSTQSLQGNHGLIVCLAATENGQLASGGENSMLEQF